MAQSDGAVQLDLTVGSIAKFQAAAESAVQGVTRTLSSSFKMLGVAALGASFGTFVKGCIDVAAYSQQTANRVNTIFPTMSEAVNNFTSDAMYTMGMTAGSAKRLMSSFGMVSQAMGLSEKQSVSMSSKLTQLSGDMAAFYGLSTDDVQSKLMGIFTGQTRGLKMLGVNMSETNLQAHALSLGISKEIAEMSDAEIATIRMSFAQQQLSKIQGYAAKNLNTWVGQTGLLNQQLKVFQSNMGKVFIAVLLPVVKLLNVLFAKLVDVSRAFTHLYELLTGNKLADVVGIQGGAVNEFADVADNAADSTAELLKAQKEAAKAAKKQEKAQKSLNLTLAGFDKINKLASNSSSLGTDAGTTVAPPSIDLGQFYDIADAAETANKAVNSISIPTSLIEALQKLKRPLSDLTEILRGGFKWAWLNILKPFGDWTLSELAPRVVNLLTRAIELLVPVAEDLGETFKWVWSEVLKPILKVYGDQLLDFLDFLDDNLGKVSSWAKRNPTTFTAIALGIAAIGAALTRHPIAAIILAIATACTLLKRTKIGDLVKDLAYKDGERFTVIADGIGAIGLAISGHPILALVIALKGLSDAFKNLLDDMKALSAEAARNFLNGMFGLKKDTDHVGGVFQTLGGLFSGFTNNLPNIGKSRRALEKYNDVLDGVGNNSSTTREKIKKLAKVWETLTGANKKSTSELKNNNTKLTATKDISSGLLGVWKLIKDKSPTLTASAKEKTPGSLDNLRSKWGTITSKKPTLTGVAVAKLGSSWDSITNAWNWLKDKTNTLTGKADDKTGTPYTNIQTKWNWLENKSQTLTGNASDKTGTPYVNVRDKWNWLKDKTNTLTGKAKDSTGTPGNNIRKIWETCVNATRTLTGTCKDAMGKPWSNVKSRWDWFKSKSATLTAKFNDSFTNPLKKAWNAVAKAINGGITKINKWTGLKIGSLPYLAQGGWVPRNSPRLAVIGDNPREGEIVAPESKLMRMAHEAAKGSTDLSQVVGVLNLILSAIQSQDNSTYLDGAEITRAVVNNVNRQTQITGRSPILV